MWTRATPGGLITAVIDLFCVTSLSSLNKEWEDCTQTIVLVQHVVFGFVICLCSWKEGRKKNADTFLLSIPQILIIGTTYV